MRVRGAFGAFIALRGWSRRRPAFSPAVRCTVPLPVYPQALMCNSAFPFLSFACARILRAKIPLTEKKRRQPILDGYSGTVHRKSTVQKWVPLLAASLILKKFLNFLATLPSDALPPMVRGRQRPVKCAIPPPNRSLRECLARKSSSSPALRHYVREQVNFSPSLR